MRSSCRDLGPRGPHLSILFLCSYMCVSSCLCSFFLCLFLYLGFCSLPNLSTEFVCHSPILGAARGDPDFWFPSPLSVSHSWGGSLLDLGKIAGGRVGPKSVETKRRAFQRAK